MSDTVIRVENLYKEYRLGVLGHGTLTRDLQSWWARVRGKEDPNAKIGQDYKNNGRRFLALEDVSLEVKQGEVLGIIGRNGAGKSTLLKILSRVTAPTKGLVKIKGRIASLLEVGTGFHPELTGRENIYLNGAILGMTKKEIDKKFDEIVDFAEIEKFIDTPVKRYSSGMYVRLAFAVAAHLEPEILLVDEVLAVGDASFQKKCLGKMGEVAQGGRTVLFVSHNMGAVQKLCRRCILLDQGNLILNDNADQVISSYLKQKTCELSYMYKATKPIEQKEGQKAFLIEAEILNSKGKPSEYLYFGEPFSIRLLWRHWSDIYGVSYAIRFYDAHERFLFAVNTLGLDLGLEAHGLHEVYCNMHHNVLIPGSYYCSIGCYIRPHTTIQSIDPCLSFSVIEVPYQAGPTFNIVGNPIFAVNAAWIHA